MKANLKNRQQPDMISVDSSVIKAIGYDRATMVLHVHLLNTKRYSYYDVPTGVFKEFLGAESKGSYFNYNIRPFYRCEEQ